MTPSPTTNATLPVSVSTTGKGVSQPVTASSRPSGLSQRHSDDPVHGFGSRCTRRPVTRSYRPSAPPSSATHTDSPSGAMADPQSAPALPGMFTTSAAPASRTSHTFTEVIAWVAGHELLAVGREGHRGHAAAQVLGRQANDLVRRVPVDGEDPRSAVGAAGGEPAGVRAPRRLRAGRWRAPWSPAAGGRCCASCTAAPSRRANAIRRPSGLQAMSAVPHAVLPNVSTSRRDLTSKTRTPPFTTELIASRRPSGLNADAPDGLPADHPRLASRSGEDPHLAGLATTPPPTGRRG